MPLPNDLHGTPFDDTDELRQAVAAFEQRLANLPRKIAATVQLETSGPRAREALKFMRVLGGWAIRVTGPTDPRDPSDDRGLCERGLSNLSLADTVKVLEALPRLCEEIGKSLAARDRMVREVRPKLKAVDDAMKALEIFHMSVGGAA